MTFFRGPDYAELEEEISSITEAKEEKQFDGAAKATEQSSILQTASKIASLKFIRPFSCIGVIYIIYELSGKYRMWDVKLISDKILDKYDLVANMLTGIRI